MAFHRALIVAACAFLIGGAGPAAAPSGTRNVSADVDVWSNLSWNTLYSGGGISNNTGISPWSGDSTLSRVNVALSRAVAAKAKELFGVSAGDLPRHFSVNVTPPPPDGGFEPFVGDGPGQSTRLTIVASLGKDDPPVAREFMDQLIAALPDVIHNQELGDLRESLDQSQKKYNEIDSEMADVHVLQQQLHAATEGYADRSADGIHALAMKLDEDRQQLNLDQAALAARREVLSKGVEQITGDADKKAHDDQVAKELQTIVDLKDKQVKLADAELNVGNSSPQLVADAQAQAAEARVQLLERREAVVRAAGGDSLVDLRAQLVQSEASLAEAQARVDLIDKESSRLSAAEDDLDQLKTLPDIATLRAAERDAQSAINDLDRQINAIPQPAIRVGSETATP